MPPRPHQLPEVVASRPLAGGDIAEVALVELADGRRAVRKRTPYDATLESEGLEALGAAGARVPAVLAVDASTLVLEHVRARPDPEALGAELATVHQHRADAFGWHRDNVIGSLPQRNPRCDTWLELYVEHRLRPYRDDLPHPLAARLDDACERVLPVLLDHGPAPSLVHGDLWSGNVLDGRVLIDPAVHHGDREIDLAMLDLFGGVPDALAAGYDAVWPLPEGWERRRPAQQLYHLLVHVRLFGAGYHDAVARRLDAIGA
jgi:fructosamine-3-kinase